MPHRPRLPSLTQFPDSPSVYSPPDLDAHFDSPAFPSPEFDDELRSLSTEDVQDDTDADDYADDASHFLSLQGPRIRFHSRAPWETDDDSSHIDDSDKNARSGMFGYRPKGKTPKTDNLIRTITRGSSIGSRPSVDSARSFTSSFEVTAGNYSSSRGALYDLARQSMSTASLTSSSASLRSQNFARTNYPKSSHYHTHDSLARAVSLDGMVPSATLDRTTMLSSSFDVVRVSHERCAKSSLARERQSHDQFVHPYANPDLVAYIPSPETIPSHHSDFADMAGSDSNSTITDSTSTISDTSTETSTTSLTSRDIPHGNLRVNGKEISSPISVLRQGDASYVDRSTRFLSLHPPPTGFEGPLRTNLNPRQPPVTLISLQEAQERERFRSNTVHTTVARSRQPFSSSEDIFETTEEQSVEMDPSGTMGHTRTPSTSAGARHNAVVLPPIQPLTEMIDESPVSTPVSAVQGRTLKHKKSGFMRLFGGRNSEGEKERSPPPPIPLPTDVHVDGKASKLSKGSKSSLSPTLRSGTSNATLASTYSASSGGEGPDWKGPSSRRRQPPSLSIVTKASNHGNATSLSGTNSSMGLNFTPPPFSLTVPQSAPPGGSDFPGLQLRPVSTSFSSHFADMVTSTAEEIQHSPSSAASSNTALSPFTPASIRRSGDTSATAGEASGEEYLAVKGLQDQLVSAKKAWQQQIWELRGQIRDLTAELEDLRAADNQEYCEACGRGEPWKRCESSDEQQSKKVGVVNRSRIRTGENARFASGS